MTNAMVAELADAPGLNLGGPRGFVGSTPTHRTTFEAQP